MANYLVSGPASFVQTLMPDFVGNFEGIGIDKIDGAMRRKGLERRRTQKLQCCGIRMEQLVIPADQYRIGRDAQHFPEGVVLADRLFSGAQSAAPVAVFGHKNPDTDNDNGESDPRPE